MKIFSIAHLYILFVLFGCNSIPEQAFFQTQEESICDEIDSVLHQVDAFPTLEIELDGERYTGNVRGLHTFYTGPELHCEERMKIEKKDYKNLFTFNSVAVFSGRLSDTFIDNKRFLYLYTQKPEKEGRPHTSGLLISKEPIKLTPPEFSKKIAESSYLKANPESHSLIEHIYFRQYDG